MKIKKSTEHITERERERERERGVLGEKGGSSWYEKMGRPVTSDLREEEGRVEASTTSPYRDILR